MRGRISRYTFKASSDDVEIKGNIVRGIRSVSNVKVTCQGITDCPSSVFLNFQVTNELVSVKSMTAHILNKLSISSNFPSDSPFPDIQTFKVEVTAENTLDNEGDSAQVFAVGKCSDDSYFVMNPADLKVTSSKLKVINSTTITVPSGATSIKGQQFVTVVWVRVGRT